MNCERFLKWIKRALTSWKIFKTLGGKALFRARYDDSSGLIIMNSRKKQYIVSDQDMKEIFDRYRNSPGEMKHRAIYYTDPKWPETPNRISSPYLPAVIRFWIEEQT